MFFKIYTSELCIVLYTGDCIKYQPLVSNNVILTMFFKALVIDNYTTLGTFPQGLTDVKK